MSIMKKKFKLTKNQKGMTLIELMAVVVILGILAAVAGAAVTGGFSKAKTSSDAASHAIVLDAAQRYFLDKDTAAAHITTISIADLTSGGYLSNTPKTSANGDFTVTVTNGNITVSP